MGLQEVRLEPMNECNIDLVLEASTASDSPHFRLPRTSEDAIERLSELEKFRAIDASDEFVAFDADRFVGVGEVVCILGRLTMGYLVEAGSRSQGYGRALAHALFTYAAHNFSYKQSIEVDVHPENAHSQTIILSMGFTPLNKRSGGGEDVYGRPLTLLNP